MSGRAVANGIPYQRPMARIDTSESHVKSWPTGLHRTPRTGGVGSVVRPVKEDES